MKRSILLLIVLAIFSGCSYQYHIWYKDGEISTMSLATTIDSKLFIEFPAEYNNQLKNFDYINGWVKIGNELFTFNKNEIKITAKTATSPSTPFINFEYEENGRTNLSEEEKINILYNCYYIFLTKSLSKKELNKIYKQENKIVEAYFEYKVTVNDEVFEIKINEKFTYSVNRRLWFLGEILLDEIVFE